MPETADETGRMDGPLPRFQGKRFYRPRVLFLYSVLVNFPVAIFLYGINVHRRGNTTGGNIIKGIAAVMIAMITAIAVVGTQVKALHLILIGLAIGIGLMQAEQSHFESCMAQGASEEKWWPPLLFVLAQAVVLVVAANMYGT